MPTDPPSPVPAPEDISEMLDEHASAWVNYRINLSVEDSKNRVDAARSKILARFAHLQSSWDFASQSWTQETEELQSEVSRLRSQVETLRDHAQIDATMHKNCCRERASLEQQMLTPDEKAGVIAVLQQTVRDCATLRMSPPPHIESALRRLSSDSETGDTKE